MFGYDGCINCSGRFVSQEEDKEEMKEILEMKTTHDKLYKRRQAKILQEQALKSSTLQGNAMLGKDNVQTLHL